MHCKSLTLFRLTVPRHSFLILQELESFAKNKFELIKANNNRSTGTNKPFASNLLTAPFLSSNMYFSLLTAPFLASLALAAGTSKLRKLSGPSLSMTLGWWHCHGYWSYDTTGRTLHHPRGYVSELLEESQLYRRQNVRILRP